MGFLIPLGAVVPKPGAFRPKDQFVWARVNTAIALGCVTKQESGLASNRSLEWFTSETTVVHTPTYAPT